jgi:MacB-like periplasmic core domain
MVIASNWQPWKVLGTSPAYLLVRDWADLEEGEAFTDADVASSGGVCILDKTPARELFGDEPPIGQLVFVRGVSLKVLGVLRRKGASMTGQDQDDLILAPYTTVKFRINSSRLSFSELNTAMPSLNQVNTLNRLYPGQPLPYPPRSPQQVADNPQLVRFADLDDIYVSATSQDELPVAVEQITALLRERQPRPRQELPIRSGNGRAYHQTWSKRTGYAVATTDREITTRERIPCGSHSTG